MQIFSLTFIIIAAISTFDQLQDPYFEPGQVKFRAFVYHLDSGGWIAADEPALKSCCRGSINKRERQIWLESDHLTDSKLLAVGDGKAVLLSGVLEKALASDEGPKWVLKNAMLAESSNEWANAAFALIFVLALITFIAFGWICKKIGLSNI